MCGVIREIYGGIRIMQKKSLIRVGDWAQGLN